ncbi:hypothetical protein Tasa_036_008 [Tanticharoenia sakaeratensis NBRC 103193]|uniref:Uncharacterized protein n=2 Tax=Tanticharoenia TaxID=444052 RepID=A0A0D6MNJ6_9PROT|nr:hypothetical protein [Tanticharoenia sakaeratensis]GAN54990.1 hypothetical protein Tasa_036_008 [Tanticharoenia sakaeratensis NBRC 103193]GBQ20445.1 hypothetical protein AA103193_1382 [Tanticharoenia sakaeratensis NBRC 103193]
MRNSFKAMLFICAAFGAGTHAYAQAVSAPSSDEPQTADKAVGKMKGSQNGKPINNNQSWPNLKRDQPDQGAPAAPKNMTTTGEVSDKVPQSQKNPTSLGRSSHHGKHAKNTANPPS